MNGLWTNWPRTNVAWTNEPKKTRHGQLGPKQLFSRKMGFKPESKIVNTWAKGIAKKYV